jgi:ATP-dependent helicase/DNAse subunit B
MLGLAEGEFPAALREDAFLRDADRLSLRDRFGFSLDPSTESAEIEFFYEAVSRPRERLLLTRPRLSSTGALWQPSPFWEEVVELIDLQPRELTSESAPAAGDSASWPELIQGLAADPGHSRVWEWVTSVKPDRLPRLEEAARLHKLRRLHGALSPFDGDLHNQAVLLVRRFGADHIWSASRLETYRTCPFFFFVAHVLRLELREEPIEGLDARKLGNIYHHILEGVYQASSVSNPTDLAQLLGALPDVARSVLDAAPRREGFRETAWWDQIRDEILGNVQRSLQALADLPREYTPCLYEVPFGLRGQPALVVHDGQDRFLVRGFIDRLDCDAAGRIRVIDYKTAGPSSFTNKAVLEGKKLQLPLYALAAQQALGLGTATEGFYWHVQHAEHSSFTLARFAGGPEAAMDVAVLRAWEAVRGVREGVFTPHPPDSGCPRYCPASGFCWRFRPGFGG